MKLYSDFAKVYDEEYLETFDYNKMIGIIENAVKDQNFIKDSKLIEIGCGTGHLAKLLIEKGFDYTGIDLSPEMIKIAEEKIKSRENKKFGKFIQADMRNLENIEESEFDLALSLGRTFSHLISNDDIISALKSINEILKFNGLLIFDNFDAREIFTHFKERTSKDLEFDDKSISRWSSNEPLLEQGWIWKWSFHYSILYKHTNMIESFYDSTLLRAFTPDELELFLKICGFEVIDKNNKKLGESTLLIIAKKISDVL